MIGNRVRVILNDFPTHNWLEGMLRKLDHAGATVYLENSLSEGQGTVFVPMHRITEIVDLGGAP